jgi:hypothetical protein
MDHEDEVKALLDQYDKKLSDLERKKQQEDALISKNYPRALQIEKEIVRPIMEKIGTHLESRGHKYQINESLESRYGPSVNMEISPKQGQFPLMSSIRFIFETKDTVVGVYQDAKVPEGKNSYIVKKYKFEELSPEIVQKEIISLLQKVL